MRVLLFVIFLPFSFVSFAEIDAQILTVNKVPFAGIWQIEKLTNKGKYFKNLPIEQVLIGKKLEVTKQGIKVEGQNCVSFSRSWIAAPHLFSSYKDDPKCRALTKQLELSDLHITQTATGQKPEIRVNGYFSSKGKRRSFSNVQFTLSPIGHQTHSIQQKITIPEVLVGTYRILPPRGLETKGRKQEVFRKDVIGKNINISANEIKLLGQTCDMSSLAYKSNIRDTRSESIYNKEKPYSTDSQYYSLRLNCPTPFQTEITPSEHFPWLDSTLTNTSIVLEQNSKGETEFYYGAYYGGMENYVLQRIDSETQETIADKMLGIWAMKPLPNGIANVVENTAQGLTKLYPFNCNKLNLGSNGELVIPEPEVRFFRYSSDPNTFITHTYSKEDKFRVNQVNDQDLSMTLRLKTRAFTFNYKKVNKIIPLCE